MGASGRDYMRERPLDDGGMAAAPWSLGVGALLVPFWLVYAIAHVQARRGFDGTGDLASAIAEFFLLDFHDLAEGRRLWTVFTAQFLHAPGTLQHILLDVVLLWHAGRELEIHRGSASVRKLMLVGLLTTPLAYMGAGALLGGSAVRYLGFDGPVLAILGALAVSPVRPRLRVLGLFTASTRAFALAASVLVIGLGALAGYHDTLAHVALGVSFGAGALLAWVVDTPIPGREDVASGRAPNRTYVPPPDLPIHEEPAPAETSPSVADERVRLDALLDKIAVVGMGGLEDEERAFLEAASKRMRRTDDPDSLSP